MRKFIVLVAVIFVPGCEENSEPTARLAGTVTINGKPVPADAEAALSFAPLRGGTSVSVPITAGRYDSPKTPLGKLLVKFYISQSVGPVKKSERTGKDYRDIANLVPPEHAAGLTIDVSEDNLNLNFDL
jgi:hypothetical protein